MRDGDLLGRVLDTFVAAHLRAEIGAERVIGIEVKATSAPDSSSAAWATLRHPVWRASAHWRSPHPLLRLTMDGSRPPR